MGTFATTTSLQDFMVGVNFDSKTSTLASKCITWGENEVRKKLSKRYDFSASPFLTSTTIPPIITQITEQLAIGYTWENSSRGSKESSKRADRMIKWAIDDIKAIQDYKLDILDSTGSKITELSNTSFRVVSNTDGYTSTFDEDDPLSWKQDPDKLTDIADERS